MIPFLAISYALVSSNSCSCVGGKTYGGYCARWDAPDEEPWCRVQDPISCGTETFEANCGVHWSRIPCRGKGAPFTSLASGEVSNQLRVVIVNRAEEDRSYTIEVLDLPGATVIAPENPLPVTAGDSVETTLFVNVPRESFTRGKRDIEFRVSDGVDYEKTFPFRLLGPYNTGRRAPAPAETQ